ncbi:hypothetical protein ARMSODRAFT_307275 [Armillaria solidipes]|uniref:Uncharacterized protein n=1 Tax=Armillaria solidipes TaxID=1076256 RepID=A0A2H3BU30_9AGAR|nr:hypothetical protein ARMSODRAFT_307275 [Armillaria solidipes]
MTDIVQGLAFENIHGVNTEDLNPGVVVYQQEAEAISSRVMDVSHTIEAENCVQHHFARLSGHHRLWIRQEDEGTNCSRTFCRLIVSCFKELGSAGMAAKKLGTTFQVNQILQCMYKE